MNRRGFTIVELLIVVAVMGVLLVLGVVNLRGTQLSSRDSERAADIAAIANSLESYYNLGGSSSSSYGYYPSTSMIGQETSYLPDLDTKAMIAPGKTTIASTMFAATSSNQTDSGIRPLPNNSTVFYVYQPIAADGSICTGTTECVKFNLFYQRELDSVVIKVSSRHQ